MTATTADTSSIYAYTYTYMFIYTYIHMYISELNHIPSTPLALVCCFELFCLPTNQLLDLKLLVLALKAYWSSNNSNSLLQFRRHSQQFSAVLSSFQVFDVSSLPLLLQLSVALSSFNAFTIKGLYRILKKRIHTQPHAHT